MRRATILRSIARLFTLDLSRKRQEPAEAFSDLQSRAASGVNGSRKAQAKVRNATLRGLEVATGKRLPDGCFR